MKLLRLFALMLVLMLCLPVMSQAAVKCENHVPVIDPGYEPTCTKDGRTQGSHCGVCGQWLVRQQIIPMLNHEYMKTPGYSAGFGYHKHHCKRCGQPWAIHCTLLDDNHCVTCEYSMELLLAAEMTEEELAAAIPGGAPLVVVTPMDAGDAVMRFSIAMYEAGEPIDFTIEARIRIPLTAEQQEQIEAGGLVLRTVRVTPGKWGAEDLVEELELEYTVEDGQLSFRSDVLSEHVLEMGDPEPAEE